MTTKYIDSIEQERQSNLILQEWWGNTKMPVQYLSPYDNHWHDTTFPLAQMLAGMPIRRKPSGIADQKPLM